MKKFFSTLILFTVLLLLSTSCFAATPVAKGDATMVLVEDNTCNISFGEYGEFQRKLSKFDEKNKSVDLTLTVKNNHDKAEAKSGEVVLLIDTSNSMSVNKVKVDGVEKTRRELVIDSAKNLIKKLLENNNNIKIGLVGFSTSLEVSEEGTDKDATIITDKLTNDEDVLLEALDTLSESVTGDRTDIEIGLNTAEKLLDTSKNTSANKYIVVLTDGVPNTASGVQMDLYTEKSATPTKEKLISLDDRGINVISMLINISEEDINITGRPEDATFKTYKDVANYVFGTSLNTTAGVVYYIKDNEIINTVTKDIYEDLTAVDEYILTDINIKDYLPKNIIDNFDFTYTSKPNIGTVSEKVNTSDNSITWTISELKPQETATLSYRLTLKNTFSNDIVGINLPTNQNATIDYKENGKAGEQKKNNKSPIVAIDVPAVKKIPQTGSNTYIIAGLVGGIAGFISILSFITLKRNSIQ